MKDAGGETGWGRFEQSLFDGCGDKNLGLDDCGLKTLGEVGEESGRTILSDLDLKKVLLLSL